MNNSVCIRCRKERVYGDIHSCKYGDLSACKIIVEINYCEEYFEEFSGKPKVEYYLTKESLEHWKQK